jgi:acyl-CoA thioesterase-2
MPDLWSDLVSCLDLSATPSGDDVFEGHNLRLPYSRVFGGQLLGQFVQAATAGIPDKSIKSLHTVFAREGRTDEPIRYRVHRHHAGRSFATLSLVAEQTAGVVATASVSLHAEEQGPQRQSVAAPPDLLSAEHKVEWDLLPWETRASVDLDDLGAAPPEFEFWMRTPRVDPALAPALTAYATDLTLIGTALLPLDGYAQGGNGTAFVSMTVAAPIPPPAHIAAIPKPPPRRRNSWTSVTIMRAPEAATGCPSEQPLPLTFTLSGSRSSARAVEQRRRPR